MLNALSCMAARCSSLLERRGTGSTAPTPRVRRRLVARQLMRSRHAGAPIARLRAGWLRRSGRAAVPCGAGLRSLPAHRGSRDRCTHDACLLPAGGVCRAARLPLRWAGEGKGGACRRRTSSAGHHGRRTCPSPRRWYRGIDLPACGGRRRTCCCSVRSVVREQPRHAAGLDWADTQPRRTLRLRPAACRAAIGSMMTTVCLLGCGSSAPPPRPAQTQRGRQAACEESGASGRPPDAPRV